MLKNAMARYLKYLLHCIMIEMMGEESPRRNELLDNENRNKLPKLYSGEEKGLETEALVKFFTPDSNWTWYVSEFDGQDLFFGLVIGHEIELDYFSLSELETVKGPLGLPIERDLHYEPQTLGELMEAHKRDRYGVQDAKLPEERQALIKKLGLFGHKLSHWDKRIVEIVGIGKIAKESLTPEDMIQLICTYSPEPMDSSEGFFSIANLLVRSDFEALSNGLGIPQSIDLGFKMGEKIFLPNGEIKEMPNEIIRVWPIYDERKQSR